MKAITKIGERNNFMLSKISLIKYQYDFLLECKAREENPSQRLLEDIKVFKFILEADNPPQKLMDFSECKDKNPWLFKVDVARKLGWF